jgi:solute:Na+ symporter, SSS family
LLLASVIGYLLLTILVGFFASKRVHTSGDFMLAGRSLPMMLSVSALFATWFGSETVFGASSEFLHGGLYAVIEDPFGAALCLILFGLFFARKLYNMNLLTLGDLFKVRFGRRTEIVASVFMVPGYFGYTAAQLVAMGLIINVITGLDVWQGILISSFVVTLYTYVGGMWAISITDFIQSIIIVIGLIVLAVVLTNQAGGVSIVLEGVHERNFKFLPDLNWHDIILYISAWSVLGLGSIPSQDVFQRVMSSGSSRIAVLSCFYAAGLYLTVAMLPLFISLCVKFLYPGEVGGDTQLVLPNMVLKHTNLFVQILFFGSLLSAIMSTTSATILAPSALISENILKPLYKNEISDSKLLLITRIAVLAYASVATILATIQKDIYELVGGASILSLVSLFIPMVAGLYWKRASSTGAILSMIFGLGIYFIFEWVIPISIPSLVPGVLASLVAMILGSLLSKPYVSKSA